MVLAASGLLVAACGSSSSSNSAKSSSASTGGTSGASGTPIKVGFVCSCSGSPANQTNIPPEDMYESWVKTVNASGGIDGHPVDLITDEDQGNPGTSLSDIQTLISDHVVAIVDNSTVDSAWASAVQQAKVPVVGLITVGTEFITNPDFFAEGQTIDSSIIGIVDTAKTAGAKNIGILYCAEAAQCAEGVPLLKKAGKQLGVPDVYNEEISSTAPNYAAQCEAAKQAHVSALFAAEASNVNARLAADCAQQGYDPIYVAEGGGFGMNMASAPDMKNNLWLESIAVPFFSTIPAVQAANAAIDKYYPGVRTSQLWNENAITGWSSGLLLEDALKGGGLTASTDPTSAMVLNGLYSLKSDTLQGMAPPLTFHRGKPNPVDCWFTARVQNGTPEVSNNGRVTCENGAS